MKKGRLHIDFETRSLVDLLRCGVYKYAECPSTDLWLASWALDDAEPGLWLPGDPMPEEIARQVRDGGIFVAHNSQFESVVWRNVLTPRYGWPAPKRESWRCTAAMAAAMSLPRSLAGAAAVLGVKEQKDDAGYRLMIQMCYPRFIVFPGAKDYHTYLAALAANPKHRGLTKMPDGRILVWWYSPSNIKTLGAYCKQDVRTERSIDNSPHMRQLSDAEQKVFVWDSLVNDRGVAVDIPMVQNARNVVRDTMAKLRDEVFVETSGYAMPTERNRIIDWLHTQGVDTDVLDKEALEALLARPDINDVVRNVLKLRGEASMSSVGKLEAMVRAACNDRRIRGMFLFNGAHTGRWAGKIVQLQNMKRPTGEIDIPEGLLGLCEDWGYELLNLLAGPPLQVVAECMRGTLVPAGHNEYVTGDFSNVEGRFNAWLANEASKLAAFRAFDAGTGPDLYLVAAAAITGRPVEEFTKESIERQWGKVSELACGYQGAIHAFHNMGKNYGVHISDKEAGRIVKMWRRTNPNIVAMWKELDEAAFQAVAQPGLKVWCCSDRICFVVHGKFLWMRLPSGRLLCYCTPEIVEYTRKVPVYTEDGDPQLGLDGKQLTKSITSPCVKFWGINSKTHRWAPNHLYGGMLCENAVQAGSRDLLVYSAFTVEALGYPVVMHSHDELVSEVARDFGDRWLDKKGKLHDRTFEAAMAKSEDWALGLPLTVDGWRGSRYRK